MKQKGIYSYDDMGSFDKFSEKQFLSKKTSTAS